MRPWSEMPELAWSLWNGEWLGAMWCVFHDTPLHNPARAFALCKFRASLPSHRRRMRRAGFP